MALLFLILHQLNLIKNQYLHIFQIILKIVIIMKILNSFQTKKEIT